MKEAKTPKAIKCQGTDYEIGKQYGEACREDLHHSIGLFNSLTQEYKISKNQIMTSVNEFSPLVKNF